MQINCNFQKPFFLNENMILISNFKRLCNAVYFSSHFAAKSVYLCWMVSNAKIYSRDKKKTLQYILVESSRGLKGIGHVQTHQCKLFKKFWMKPVHIYCRDLFSSLRNLRFCTEQIMNKFEQSNPHKKVSWIVK